MLRRFFLTACYGGRNASLQSATSTVRPNLNESPNMTASQDQSPGPGSTVTPPISISASWNGIPILSDAFSVAEGAGKFIYTTHSTMYVVQIYYDQIMPKLGWQHLETGNGLYGGVQLVFYKDGRTVSIILKQDGERVIVMLSI